MLTGHIIAVENGKYVSFCLAGIHILHAYHNEKETPINRLHDMTKLEQL